MDFVPSGGFLFSGSPPELDLPILKPKPDNVGNILLRVPSSQSARSACSFSPAAQPAFSAVVGTAKLFWKRNNPNVIVRGRDSHYSMGFIFMVLNWLANNNSNKKKNHEY